METVPISILRVKIVPDGYGGEEEILSSDRKRYEAILTRRNTTGFEERLEEGKRNSSGPGVQEATRRIFCFSPPFPPVTREERLVDPDGAKYIVHHVRPYGWTLQVDCEIVE